MSTVADLQFVYDGSNLKSMEDQIKILTEAYCIEGKGKLAFVTREEDAFLTREKDTLKITAWKKDKRRYSDLPELDMLELSGALPATKSIDGIFLRHGHSPTAIVEQANTSDVYLYISGQRFHIELGSPYDSEDLERRRHSGSFSANLRTDDIRTPGAPLLKSADRERLLLGIAGTQYRINYFPK